MRKTVRTINIIALILTGVEVLLVGAFICLWLLNSWGLSDLIKPEYIVIGVFVTVFINCLAVWIFICLIYAKRKKYDINTGDIVGNDMQEAYRFGEIGYVLVDENNIVVFESNLLRDREFGLINQNIFNEIPALNGFNTGDADTISLEFGKKNNDNKRNYEVKYLKSAGLFIFKDISLTLKYKS